MGNHDETLLNSENEQILLTLSGRMRRHRDCNKPFLIYLKKDVGAEIDRLCQGNKSAIINHLLRLGLDALKNEVAKESNSFKEAEKMLEV